MVVGRFSRGKSTLMNAILGRDYLPTGIVPLTSVITTVRYGSREQVVLNFDGSGLRREVPLSRLPEYVTQKGNPGNAKKLAYAEIQLPVEILRRGLFFVDSPGLGSPILENTATTERFVLSADAFVLVTSYESPLSEEEDRILRRIRNTNRRLFTVLNKQDTVSVSDRREALEFVSERVKQFSFDGAAKVFSVSARQALEAKQARDAAQLKESGIQEFEDVLLRFLIEEQAQAFLTNMFERTTAFLIQQAHSRQGSSAELELRALAENLARQRDSICGIDSALDQTAQIEADRSLTYTLDVDSKTGCRLCGLTLEGVFRFLSRYQYELTFNPDTQIEHARRGGFCQLHTWQYEGIASPQGICESYPRLVHGRAASLRRLASETQNRDGIETVRNLLPTTKSCRLCEVRAAVEREAVAAVAAQIREVAEKEDSHLPACCLTHLALVIESLGPGKLTDQLIESHAILLERTAEDLQRYALKHDALRRYLTSEEERRAAHLALLLLAGHRNLAAPWVIEWSL
jgi:GTPase Era involved in 16S rRNA processing